MWYTSQEGAPRPERDDPTVMAIDLETEEIYESRVYPLRPHPVALALLAQAAAATGRPVTAEAFAHFVDSFLEETSLKVLAKRRKRDGGIAYIVVAVNPFQRAALQQGEVADEAAYRQLIARLEEALLAPGLLGEPLVISSEEWRQYEQGIN